MAQTKDKSVEEEVGGAPEWMATFSDCMTLLLTFFVLLLSFATFEDDTLPMLGYSFAQAMPSVGLSSLSDKESFWEKQETRDSVNQTKGTETRSTATEMTSNFMKEKKPLDFRNMKVFTVPSNQFFYGKGKAISAEGRQVLDALARFLESTTGRVVISENGPDGHIDLGLNRCLAVLEYLTKEKKLPPDRLSITASSTMRTPPDQRQLEITLLERGLYE